MNKICFVAVVSVCAALAGPALGEDQSPRAADNWLDVGVMLAQADKKASMADAAGAAPSNAEGPPIPFHCIEGYSGGVITPMAYICNADGASDTIGQPVFSYTFLDLGTKEIQAFAVTVPLFRRIEFGYAFNYFTLGSLFDDLNRAVVTPATVVSVPDGEGDRYVTVPARTVEKMDFNQGTEGYRYVTVPARTMNPSRDNFWLHHFNVRGMLVEENSFDLPLPAVTAGVHFKYNHGINSLNRSLGGALSRIGFERSNGTDFTLTASKMFPTLAFGCPVIVTGGIRWSEAAQIGLLGFGDTYDTTFEGSVACLPTDWLVLAYEVRQKDNPYTEINGLLGDEDWWQAFSASWIVNDNLSLSAVWGMFGNVANARADNTLAVQAKWEF